MIQQKTIYLNNDSNFRVPFADQRSIVDIRRSTDDGLVVDYHQFRMDVNQFGQRFGIETSVISETVKRDVLRRIVNSGGFESVQKCVLSSKKKNRWIKFICLDNDPCHLKNRLTINVCYELLYIFFINPTIKPVVNIIRLLTKLSYVNWLIKS